MVFGLETKLKRYTYFYYAVAIYTILATIIMIIKVAYVIFIIVTTQCIIIPVQIYLDLGFVLGSLIILKIIISKTKTGYWQELVKELYAKNPEYINDELFERVKNDCPKGYETILKTYNELSYNKLSGED